MHSATTSEGSKLCPWTLSHTRIEAWEQDYQWVIHKEWCGLIGNCAYLCFSSLLEGDIWDIAIIFTILVGASTSVTLYIHI